MHIYNDDIIQNWVTAMKKYIRTSIILKDYNDNEFYNYIYRESLSYVLNNKYNLDKGNWNTDKTDALAVKMTTEMVKYRKNVKVKEPEIIEIHRNEYFRLPKPHYSPAKLQKKSKYSMFE